MPSIQGEIEAEARRSQSLDFSNGVVDPYLDEESKLTYHEETWTYDPVTDTMTVDKQIIRAPYPKK